MMDDDHDYIVFEIEAYVGDHPYATDDDLEEHLRRFCAAVCGMQVHRHADGTLEFMAIKH